MCWNYDGQLIDMQIVIVNSPKKLSIHLSLIKVETNIIKIPCYISSKNYCVLIIRIKIKLR